MLGIMGATPEEISSLLEHTEHTETSYFSGREFHKGLLESVPVVIAFSRWGKVASACTASILCQHFNVNRLIFTGVAAGVGTQVQRGDIVIPESVLQHDMDARPFFRKFQIPLTEIIHFPCDPQIVNTMRSAAAQVSSRRRIHHGVIASGDQFIKSTEKVDTLISEIPNLQAVEMEGAAVSQVAHDFGIPFGLVRIISDRADQDAPCDFQEFLNTVAGPACYSVVSQWLKDHSV